MANDERLAWAAEQIAQLNQEIKQLEAKAALYQTSYDRDIGQLQARVNALQMETGT